MNELYFITGNKGKVLESKKKFSEIGIKIIQKDLGYPEIQAENLEDVALFGAKNVLKKFDKPFILEDAGLFINSLDGFPGVYSAYVFYTIGCKGILKLMHNVDDKNRNAAFKSVYVYAKPGKKPKLFLGECLGAISFEERGDNGFGYDPIFIPKNSSKTFAEMNTDEKNILSHRGRSLDKLLDFFKNL
jgi:XTP/dITP diphosphohydrolase